MRHFLLIPFFLLLFSLLGSHSLKAQYAFRVMATTGKSISNTKILQTGSQLKTQDNISVQPKSYLSLIHRSGGTVQISTEKSAVDRSINALEENLRKNRYQTYIISDNQQSSSNHKYINVLSAIERKKETLEALLPRHTYLMNSDFVVSWNPAVETQTYLIQIFSFEDKLLHTYNTNDTKTIIHLQDFISKIESDQNFIIKISSKEKPEIRTDTGFGFTVMTSQEQFNFNAQYNKLQTELTGTGNAFDKISEAALYEENNLFLEALSCYSDLLKMDTPQPQDKEAYFIAYQHFLERNNVSLNLE